MRALWWRLCAKWEYVVLWRARTARHFLRWAWWSLRGKWGMIDSRITESRGGYKYLTVDMSVLPVSKTQMYDGS